MAGIVGIDTTESLRFENDRTLIRPITEQDIHALLHIAESQPDLLFYSPSAFGTKKALKNYVLAALEQKELGGRFPFIIFDKKAKNWAGSTSFGNISNAHKRVEIGWTWIGEKFQRTGLNRNNKYLLLQHAFEVAGFERVEFKTDTRNTQSRSALEKIGAKEEGILRSHTILSNKHRRDTIYYSILKDEWPEIKETIFKDYQ